MLLLSFPERGEKTVSERAFIDEFVFYALEYCCAVVFNISPQYSRRTFETVLSLVYGNHLHPRS